MNPLQNENPFNQVEGYSHQIEGQSHQIEGRPQQPSALSPDLSNKGICRASSQPANAEKVSLARKFGGAFLLLLASPLLAIQTAYVGLRVAGEFLWGKFGHVMVSDVGIKPEDLEKRSGQIKKENREDAEAQIKATVGSLVDNIMLLGTGIKTKYEEKGDDEKFKLASDRSGARLQKELDTIKAQNERFLRS